MTLQHTSSCLSELKARRIHNCSSNVFERLAGSAREYDGVQVRGRVDSQSLWNGAGEREFAPAGIRFGLYAR